YPLKVQRRKRGSGGQGGKPGGRVQERDWLQRLPRYRVGRRVLVVELDLLEYAPGGLRIACNHVSDLARDREISAAVVPDVQDEFVDAGSCKLLDRVHEIFFRRGDMIIEQQVADGADGRGYRFHVLHR